MSETVEKNVVITFSARSTIKETTDEIQINLRGLSFQFMALGYSLNELNRLLLNNSQAGKVLAGVMQGVGAAFRIANVMATFNDMLQKIALSSWLVTAAEKARALAHFIANAVASGGLLVPAMIAAAATSGIIAGYFLSKGMAAGGIVTKPTIALLGEAGPEIVLPLSRGAGGIGTVYVDARGSTFASDYDVDKMMNRVVDRLKRAGVVER
jgi:SLT domain-containing protein